ncbi:hypothetical protein Misp01_45000 [Microtetraspora sp. NBRC 13810]|uniref:hypothetical protein n=1 Tax=Microtetraspora sp. NBRC 13810 TaxID=3030990 RepID=UPI0024A57BFE|nr:hypothetical protein [Microtetraspora sp. NBRC 13810]GLW09371.1 hypothetical protein Misp01_45000 [Microtetraspora sp. NBRC 13810]
MSDRPILLKVLLHQRRWQAYGTFQREYDRVAKSVDPVLVRTWPSRAQLHRWLSGTVKGLPYPDHCRILEAMFPDWTAHQLFAPAPGDIPNLRQQPPGTPETVPAVVPPVGLRPYLERAFERRHVSIDFAGFSGETLQGAVQEPLDKIRYGQLKPESVTIRLLLPDTSRPMTLPCKADDLADDPDFRARANTIMRRHATAITDSVNELAARGAVKAATAEIRLHQVAPLFKLYIVNDRDAFFGFYPIQEYDLRVDDQSRTVYDLMGKDAVVFHHSTDNDAGREYIKQSRLWFESIWNTISREFNG